MPVLVNKSTGLAEDLSNEAASVAAQSGSHAVPLYDPAGNQVNADYGDAGNLLQQGYSQPRPEELSALLEHAKYNSAGHEIGAAALGAAEGLAGPLGTAAAKLVASDKEINKTKEYNPGLHAAGQMAGLGLGAFTGTGEAALLGKAGEAVKGVLGMGRVGSAAAAGLVENALFQSGDELSKLITGDPKQSAETAIANVGLSGLLGAGAGGALGAVSKGWEGLGGSKLGQVIEDFKGRVAQHLDNPDPAATLTKELQDLHTNLTDMNHEVYGATGLKAQDIQKLLPEQVTPRIAEEPTRITSLIQDSIDKMQDRPFKYGGDRYPGLLQEALDDFKAASTDARQPADIFNAVNELKQKLGQYTKPVLPDNPAYDAVKELQGVGKKLRASLEDSEVWGKAADRQSAINKAFTEFKAPLKDFESKFTTKLGDGTRVVDPGKVNTYVNQLGKPNAEIKQDVLRSFLEASDKYKATVADTHANLGIDNPYTPTSTTVAADSVNDLTPGAKLADAIIKKGVGKILGTAIGAGAGSAVGHPYIGGLLGEKLLSPSINKVVPAIIRPILENQTSGPGMKGAVQYGLAVLKGEDSLSAAAKAVFGAGTKEWGAVKSADREKLKEHLNEIAQNPNMLMDVGGKTGHYLPDHAAHMATTATAAVRYLQTLRPQTAPLSPLDAERVPSKTEEAAYNNALDIAQKPELVMQAIKDGSLTVADMQALQAMYPNLASRMRDKLGQELINAKSKGTKIPYKTALSLSVFLGQPLESSMQPTAIMANQPMPAQAPQAPAPGHRGPSSRGHNMTQTAKLPSSYMTPQQARAQSRLKP